jgi:hypothetical protein
MPNCDILGMRLRVTRCAAAFPLLLSYTAQARGEPGRAQLRAYRILE